MLNQGGIPSASHRATAAPDMAALHALLSQALARPGLHNKTSWRSADHQTEFVLDVIGSSKGGDPKWQLYREHAGNRQLLFDYASCDVLLVHNFIGSSCAAVGAESGAQAKSRKVVVPDTPPPFMGNSDAEPPAAGGSGSGSGSSSGPSSNTGMQGNQLGSVARSPLPGSGAAPAGSSPAPASHPLTPQPFTGQAAGRVQPGNSQSQSAAGGSAGSQSAGSQSAGPQSAGPQSTGSSSTGPQSASALDPQLMQGDLANLPLAKLLHGLRSAKMTGRLEVRHGHTTALLFVKDGMPVDATAGDSEGDEALVELLTWKTGQYSFESRVLRHSHTVHQPIESLLAQSKQLAERIDYLTGLGLSHNSTFTIRQGNLSDAEFAQKVSSGAPLSLDEVTRFYRSLDGRQLFDEILHTAPFSRGQIINLIYHLVITGLIKISNPIVLETKSELRPRAIDANAIQSVMMSLRRLETGMFIYPAFLYFLEQEYFRCYRSKTPLSVIVFEMRVQTDESARQPLSSAAVLDAVLRISQLKRHVDLLAHYDTSDYALLLPNTKANGAQTFAKRIVAALTETPLAGEVDGSHLKLALGCASMPEDYSDPAELLGAADMAMAQSRDRKKPVVMYRDIKPIAL